MSELWTNDLFSGALSDFLGGVATEITFRLVDFISYQARKPFKTEAGEVALQTAVQEAVATTFAPYAAQPELFQEYVHMFKTWAMREAVSGELSQLLDPRPGATLDLALLTAEFAAMGYDPDYLTEAFEEIVARFAAAFYDAAGRQAAFFPSISIQLLRGMVEQLAALAKSSQRTAQAATQIANVLTQPAARARRFYLTKLYDHCNWLPLVAFGSEDDDVTLTQLYVDLEVTTEHESRRQSGTQIELFDRQKRYGALEIAAKEKRLVLLGDPGSGKSSFVRHLTACLAQAGLGQADPPAGFAPLLPVLVTLRELGARLAGLPLVGISGDRRRQRLLTAVEAQWREDVERLGAADFYDALREQLLDGRALLIFDGLDEVPAAVRELVQEAVHITLQAYRKLPHVIVTCRIRSYPTDRQRQLAGFATHTIAPFTEEKIAEFVAKWYRGRAIGQLALGVLQERVADLQRAAAADNLRELAENPMLLTTMAIIHQQRVGLPKQRVKLYAEAVDLLLHRWQKHKNMEISPALAEALEDKKRMRRLLERVGYLAHQRLDPQAETADLPRLQLYEMLETPEMLGSLSLAEQFLDYVDQQAGLLVGIGGETGKPLRYTFAHRTFLEYLAGCEMVNGRSYMIQRIYWQHLPQGNDWYLAAQLGAEELLHNNEKGGTEACLELAYSLCPEAEPASEADWRAVVWSGYIARQLETSVIEQDVAFGGGAYLERLRLRLAAVLTTNLPLLERAEAGRTLGWLGDGRPEVVAAVPVVVPVAAGSFWLGSDKKQDSDADNDAMLLHEQQLPTYAIGKYPVTVAQFGRFVAAGGYTAAWRHCWPAAGWEWKEKGGVTEPRYWQDTRWTVPNHPVVGVSWYEAVAYCHWLRETTGRQFQLPDEAMWEKAAAWVPGEEEAGERGSGGAGVKRRYPWGDAWDAGRLNASETRIGQTTAVGLFSDGRSAYGAYDMAGNVWEWCSGAGYSEAKYPLQRRPYEEDVAQMTRTRALRGGAFSSNNIYCRAAYRHYYYPHYRDINVGFRVAEHLSDSES